MPVNGHWTVRFASVAGEKVQRESGGVATFCSGRIVGGDTWTYYVGDYQLSGKQLTLRLDVSIHFTEGGESILGGPLVPYTLVGEGELSEDGLRIDASVHVAGNDNATIVAILSRVADFE